MAIPANNVSIGDTTKKSHYDALYDNAILCDTGGTAGGAQTVPGIKTFTDGIAIGSVYDINSAIKLKIDNATDSIGIGGYAGGSNRECTIYFASDAYIKWIEASDKFSIPKLLMLNGNLETTAHKNYDIGTAVEAFDDVYADDFQNVADFFHLDSHDDVKAICDIRGSGKIDPKTGLEFIDDDTLPEWLLAKSKDGKEILYASDGKPYISLKTAISLSWGAIRQLKGEIDKLRG